MICTIEDCDNTARNAGPWCDEHWPYRCWCGAIGTECEVYSVLDSDQDRWFCKDHYVEHLERNP